MSQQFIDVKVDAFGNTKVDAVGFKGNTCEAATLYLEQALGGKKLKDERKPEFSQGNVQPQKQNLRF